MKCGRQYLILKRNKQTCVSGVSRLGGTAPALGPRSSVTGKKGSQETTPGERRSCGWCECVTRREAIAGRDVVADRRTFKSR